ncbi:MAG: hypothetical protein KUL82_07720 [Bdellovibrio sp.]|nr:hypothetical protein [Bdellovibrio sp.]
MKRDEIDALEMTGSEYLTPCCILYRDLFAEIQNPPDQGDFHEEVHQCIFCGEKMLLEFSRQNVH